MMAAANDAIVRTIRAAQVARRAPQREAVVAGRPVYCDVCRARLLPSVASRATR